MQEAFSQAGFGPAWPYLPLILLVVGGVLIYFGFSWFPEEMAEDYGEWPWSTNRPWPWIPFWSQSALGMIACGGLLIYLAYELSH